MKEKSSVPDGSEIDQLELALKSLGFDLEGDTDPALMEVLIHKLGFAQIIDGAAGSLMQRLVKEKIPLLPLRNKIVQGLIQNEPLKKTLLEAQEKQLHLNRGNAEQIKNSIYLMVLLEVITTLMVNDASFSNAIMDEMLAKRGVKKKGDSLTNLASITWSIGDIFVGIKTVSLEPAMWLYRCWRKYDGNPTKKQCKEFIKEHGLTTLNVMSIMGELDKTKVDTHKGLRSNIIEAVKVQPSQSQGEYNQMAGFALTTYLEEAVPKSSYEYAYVREPSSNSSSFWDKLYQHKPQNNIIACNDFSQEWVNLYESWNMAFTLSKYPDKFHLLFPKLL